MPLQKIVGLSKLKDMFEEMGANKVVERYVLDLSKWMSGDGDVIIRRICLPITKFF